MAMLVTKIFTFDAAHFLTKYHGVCERLHGHTYRLEVTVEGEPQSNGMLLDFGILKKIVKKQVLDKCDHYCFNDFLENPTAERIAVWIWEQLVDLPKYLQEEADDPNLDESIKKLLEDPEKAKKEMNTKVKLYEIKLWETGTSFVTYRG